MSETETQYLDYFTSKDGIDKMILRIEIKFDDKDIPKQHKATLDTLKTTLGVINYLYDNLDKEYKANEKLGKQINTLAFSNGMLKRENEKLVREKNRLLKNIKI